MQNSPACLDELIVPNPIPFKVSLSLVMLAAVDLDREFDVLDGDVGVPNASAKLHRMVGHPVGDACLAKAAVDYSFAHCPRIPRDIRDGDASKHLTTAATTTFERLLQSGCIDPAHAESCLQPVGFGTSRQVEAGAGRPRHPDPILKICIPWVDIAPDQPNSVLRVAAMRRRDDHRHHGGRLWYQSQPPSGCTAGNRRIVTRPQPARPHPGPLTERSRRCLENAREDSDPLLAPDEIVDTRAGDSCGKCLVTPDDAVLSRQNGVEPDDARELDRIHASS